MRRQALLLAFCVATAFGENCLVNEDFTRGKTKGLLLQDKGEWTREGWKVGSGQTQLKYDLGKHYKKGSVEIQVRGPLMQPKKHSLIAGWNEEAAADGDRKTQNFYQLRLQENAMMLRLTNRSGGRSFEGKTGPISWTDGWHTVKGTWDTTGGENHLLLDGKLLRSGKFNAETEGFRWFFLGKDNYQKQYSVPGLIYRNVKICVE